MTDEARYGYLVKHVRHEDVDYEGVFSTYDAADTWRRQEAEIIQVTQHSWYDFQTRITHGTVRRLVGIAHTEEHKRELLDYAREWGFQQWNIERVVLKP